MRVVSLLPAATEICYALGVEPVATSHECDYPPAAAETPSVVEPRIDDTAGSAEIDRQVREAMASGGVYAIDRERLAAADPDLVVTQGLCEVCAVDTIAVEAAIDELGLDCELLTVDPHRLEDVYGDIRRIGGALDRHEQADDLVADLQARVDAVADRATASPIQPDVAVLDWLDPVMVAGHWVPELVELAGGTYGLAEAGAAASSREWARVREYDPDILVAAPCGFTLAQTRANAADLLERPGWQQLRAVRMNRTYAVDGHHLLNRPGPRLVDTLEVLAGLIQPDLFDVPEPDDAEPLVRSPA